MTIDMKYFYQDNEYCIKVVTEYFNKVGMIFFDLSNSISIILIGSLSRGEGTWKHSDGKYIILSDIEYWIVFDNKEISKSDMNYKILELEKLNASYKDTMPSVLFHIDFTTMSLSQAKKLPRHLIVFESLTLGKNMVGKEYLGQLRLFHPQEIDPNDIFDILCHRAYSVLTYTIGEKPQLKAYEIKYILSKNILDLFSYYLYSKRLFTAGLTNRNEAMLALKKQGIISNEYYSLFQQCLLIKISPDNSDSTTIEYLSKMFTYLIEIMFSIDIKKAAMNRNRHVVQNIRENIGRLRRAILCKRVVIVRKKHLKKMINMIKFQQANSKEMKSISINQFILYGFPIVCKENKL